MVASRIDYGDFVMNSFQLLGQLLPPVSYQITDDGEWLAAAKEQDSINVQAFSLATAPFVDLNNAYIARWEAVLNLIPASDAGIEQRVRRVLAKLNDMGGLSIAYFTTLAEQAGYTIRITELDQFRAGTGRAGDHLNPDEIMWVWQVDVFGPAKTIYFFRAGTSHAGDRIRVYTDPIIETMFKDLKPAHTWVRFEYLEN